MALRYFAAVGFPAMLNAIKPIHNPRPRFGSKGIALTE